MEALTAVPQTVCQAAIDLPCSWVEVEFSDETKIGVSYDAQNTPARVATLLRQVPTLRMVFKSYP